MAKITWPAITNKAYRGTISLFRTELLLRASQTDKETGLKAEFIAQAGKFLNYLGSAILANSAAVSVRNSAGAAAHTGTSVVAADGTLTGVNLPATTAMVDSTVKVTTTITGTIGTGITFTVANGVITAGVLS